MTPVGAAPLPGIRAWRWPLELSRYDRRGMLRPAELAALRSLGWGLRRLCRDEVSGPQWRTLRRLVGPLDDAYAALRWRPDDKRDQRAARDAIAVVLRRCEQLQTSYWSWDVGAWTSLITPGAREFRTNWPSFIDGSVRQYVICYAYLLGEVTYLHAIGAFQRLHLAWRIFGEEPVNTAVDHVFRVLAEWGYQRTKPAQVTVTLTEAMLRNRSPHLAELTTEALVRIRDEPGLGRQARRNLYGIHRAVAALGHAEQCPHRMACARCDFYLPKQSTKGQLLEAKDNLQRMLAAVPLTDDERAAVDDGQVALDRLLYQLADVPAPDGHTPRQIGAPATATLLPIVEVRQGKTE